MRRDKLEVFWAGFIYIYNNVFPMSPQAGFPNVSRPQIISPDRLFSMTGI